MTFNPSSSIDDSELGLESRSNIKSDFTLFPSSPLDSFLCQTSDPISSRLFSQPEPGSFCMDTISPPENAPTENYKTFHHLPSPLCSIIRDPEATLSPVSKSLGYHNTGFNHNQGQNTIHSNPSSNRVMDLDSSQRIPYSPESLSSEYRHSASQDTIDGAAKVVARSPGQNPTNSHSSGAYSMGEPTGSAPYLPPTFHQDREPTPRHSSGGRMTQRNHCVRYSPYSTSSSSHQDGMRAASYEEQIQPGSIVEDTYNHVSLRQGERQREPHGVEPTVSAWPRSWPNTSSPSLRAPQQHPSSPPYTSHYPALDTVSTKVYATPTYEPYQQEILQLPLRTGEIEVINPGPAANAIHCLHCTQKFTSSELYTKHQQKHQKMYRCRFDNCARTEGFATPNDRERHEKSVHKIPGFYWRCLDPSCSSYRKEFARRDNLKDHLKRMHTIPPGVDEAEANAWRSQMADNGKYEKPDISTLGQH